MSDLKHTYNIHGPDVEQMQLLFLCNLVFCIFQSHRHDLANDYFHLVVKSFGVNTIVQPVLVFSSHLIVQCQLNQDMEALFYYY